MTIKEQVVLQLSKLPSLEVNDAQVEQITKRILQIVGEGEYLKADDMRQMYLIRQVWPIAQYVDTP